MDSKYWPKKHWHKSYWFKKYWWGTVLDRVLAACSFAVGAIANITGVHSTEGTANFTITTISDILGKAIRQGYTVVSLSTVGTAFGKLIGTEMIKVRMRFILKIVKELRGMEKL